MIVYKEDLKKDLMEIFNQYLQEEGGNRLTTFNMNGLIMRINQALDKNELKSEDKPPLKTVKKEW